MNGRDCECGMWLYTPQIEKMHFVPFSKDGTTTSEHKEALNRKQWNELYTAVWDVKERITKEDRFAF